MSRGSVREALLIVERRHLIRIILRRGAIVSKLDVSGVNELTEFYAELLLMVFARIAADVAGNSRANQLDGLRCVLNVMTEHQDAQAIDALVAAKISFCRAAIDLQSNSYLKAYSRIDERRASYQAVRRTKHISIRVTRCPRALRRSDRQRSRPAGEFACALPPRGAVGTDAVIG